MLFRIALTTALFFMCGCSSIGLHHYQAVVNPHQTSSPNTYSSIQAALDAAPTGNKKPFRIFIAPGDYYEKIIIAKPMVHLIGTDQHNTRIYYDAYAGQEATHPGATPGQIWGTTGAATLIIRAADVQLENLSIENTFDFLRNDALPDNHPQRITHTQSPALHLDYGSDRFIGRDLRILSHHDTLFVNSGRSWFDKVLIAGSIDFIFGKGNGLFTHSEIKSLARAKQTNPQGYILAPSTNIAEQYGFTFIDCKLTRTPNLPDMSTALGRPWHPTTQFPDGRYADPNAIGKAIFINTWMGAHIADYGWSSMKGTAKDGSKIQFNPEDARFFEYGSTGPGAAINKNRKQLSIEELGEYSVKEILKSW